MTDQSNWPVSPRGGWEAQTKMWIFAFDHRLTCSMGALHSALSPSALLVGRSPSVTLASSRDRCKR